MGNLILECRYNNKTVVSKKVPFPEVDVRTTAGQKRVQALLNQTLSAMAKTLKQIEATEIEARRESRGAPKLISMGVVES